MPRLTCPECRLLLSPRSPLIAPEYCPRCLARRKTAILLVAADRQRLSHPCSAETTRPTAPPTIAAASGGR
jgi:hypothetical protein